MTDPTPTTPDLLALANRLTVARVRAGLSQAEAARRSGCGRSYLSELENAKHTPNALMLASLADTYGVTVDDLLGRTTVPAPATVDRDDSVLSALVTWLDKPHQGWRWDDLRALLPKCWGDKPNPLPEGWPEEDEDAAPAVPATDDQEPDVDLVHRVAAAICAVDAPADHPDIWGSPEDWYAEARAAIAAMREVPRG